MRGEDHVGQPTQLVVELLGPTAGLDREHVDRCACEVAADEVVPQRGGVDHETAGEVEEQRPGLHRRELLGAEQPGVALAAVDVQRDHVGHGEQFGHRAAAAGIAQRQLVDGVVEVHDHAQRLGQHRQLRADIAVPDDPQGPAADLVRAGRGLVPDTVVHEPALLHQPPGQRDDFGQRQLHHGAGVGVRRVEHRDALVGSGREVDLVGADAERTHREQRVGPRQVLGGDLGLGTDPQQLHALEPLR